MPDNAEDLVLRLHREEVERLRGKPPEQSARATALSFDLPEGDPHGPLAEEWQLFRQEVARLIEEGYRGRFVLVKVGQSITVWDTLRDAAQAGQLLYGPGPCLIQEIQPFLRPLSMGYDRRCRA
jgi:hypothetical protein